VNTILTPEAAEQIAVRHDGMWLRREAKRKKGEDFTPDSLVRPQSFGRIRWINGTIQDTDIPIRIMQRWCRSFPKGEQIAVSVGQGEVRFRHGDSELSLVATNEAVPVTEPVVCVNCDGPQAVVIEPQGDTAADLKTLKKDLASARKEEQRSRKIQKVTEELRRAMRGINMLRAEVVGHVQALRTEGGKHTAIINVRKEREVKAYMRSIERCLTRPLVGWSKRQSWDSPLLYVDQGRLCALPALCHDDDFNAERIEEWAKTPTRFTAKREAIAVEIVKELLGKANEYVTSTWPDVVEYLRLDLNRRRQSDPWEVCAWVAFKPCSYRVARRFMRGYADRKKRALAELSNAILAYKLAIQKGN
jgi:hypothetical protein